ncbi:hypothetical protein KFL_002460050 [Klebsormidium nitens]|uniref:Uncharacterized protein n=1 Tax=Klebsormidium nitens TaxID=105231 RepID=A0A1Y1IC14_KLENI|nr:hypothetical protein KFL_002460050 [Klebsormidium nitens]|eukprot:GAQ85628.1 hypothetical protein KFL_002460050 [Klebsormidium nitens]
MESVSSPEVTVSRPTSAPARAGARGDPVLLRDACVLVNATRGQKTEALWKIHGARRLRDNNPGEALLTSEETEDLALLEVVELAAAPHLARDPATGRFAAPRASEPRGWTASALVWMERQRIAARGYDGDSEDLKIPLLTEGECSHVSSEMESRASRLVQEVVRVLERS